MSFGAMFASLIKLINKENMQEYGGVRKHGLIGWKTWIKQDVCTSIIKASRVN